jgi:tripartite-type tricarboxylate transporter receptor subunit TctC
MKISKLLSVCFITIGLISAASAEVWPARAVKIVVPYPAGGGVDPVARLVGQKLSTLWNQPVLVENKPGASGSIGAYYVAKSAPDGLTIMMSATAEVVINQFIMTKMNYNPETDLVPVTLAVRLPFVLVTKPTSPFKNTEELISYAKKNPGKVSYASSGNGTPQHLAAVLFEQLAGVKMVHIPYKGVALSVSDLLAGHVDVGFVGLPTGLSHIHSGALRALGVSSKTASPAAPEILPLSVTKLLSDFELNQWFGVFVPAGTPPSVIAKIQKDTSDVLKMPDVNDALVKQGAQPSGMPTEEFNTYVKSERNKFEKIVKAANIQP